MMITYYTHTNKENLQDIPILSLSLLISFIISRYISGNKNYNILRK